MATFATRPDPNFYINIQQFDNGDWTADQMALDDVTVTIPMHGDVITKGLRTLTKDNIDLYTFQSVQINAPPDMQRDSLYIVTKGTGAAGYASAKACLDWVEAMNVKRDTLKTSVSTMNFNQLIVFVITEAGWPALPGNMPPKSFAPGATESRRVMDAPKVTKPTIVG